MGASRRVGPCAGLALTLSLAACTGVPAAVHAARARTSSPAPAATTPEHAADALAKPPSTATPLAITSPGTLASAAPSPTIALASTAPAALVTPPAGMGIVSGNGAGIVSGNGAGLDGPGAGNLVGNGGNPMPAAALAGTVRVPAAIISDGGSTVLANHGAGYRLFATDGTAPAPAVQVALVDATGAALPGTSPVTTDASGHYSFPVLPAGAGAVYVQARLVANGSTYTFGALARIAAPTGTTADINPATTLVQQKAIAVLAEQDGKPEQLDAGKLATLESAAQTVLATGTLPDFSQPAKVLVSGFDKLLQGHADLESAAWALDRNVGTPMVRAKQALAGGIASPEHVAYNANGDLFIAGLDDYTIWKLPAGGTTLVPFAKSPDLKWPHGIAVDAKGNVYASRRIDLHYDDPANPTHNDTPGKQVFKIDPTGQSVTPLAYTFAAPTGLCVDHDGHTLYVANSQGNGGELLAYDTATDTVHPVASGLAYCNGVAQDSAGALYVTHQRYDTSDPDAGKNGWRGAISKIDAAGKQALFYPGYMDVTGADALEGIAVDAADNLYGTDNWGNTIFKFTPKQKKIQTFLTFDQPTGVAFDRHGNLVVANYITGTLTLLTP